MSIQITIPATAKLPGMSATVRLEAFPDGTLRAKSARVSIPELGPAASHKHCDGAVTIGRNDDGRCCEVEVTNHPDGLGEFSSESRGDSIIIAMFGVADGCLSMGHLICDEINIHAEEES